MKDKLLDLFITSVKNGNDRLKAKDLMSVSTKKDDTKWDVPNIRVRKELLYQTMGFLGRKEYEYYICIGNDGNDYELNSTEYDSCVAAYDDMEYAKLI